MEKILGGQDGEVGAIYNTVVVKVAGWIDPYVRIGLIFADVPGLNKIPVRKCSFGFHLSGRFAYYVGVV